MPVSCKPGPRLMPLALGASLALAAGAAHAQPDNFDYGVIYKQDLIRNMSGGLHTGWAGPGTVDLFASLNATPNDTFYVDLLGTFGGFPSELVGDLQATDNIEAYNTLTVFEAWYQHTFGDSGFSLKGGLTDYNADFYALDAAGLFINSSFGLGPDVSQLGVSTFPTSALGLTAKWESAGGLYAQAAVYDGVPGLPGHPAGLHVELRDGDGVFTAAEAGITGAVNGLPYKFGVGGWYHTKEFEDPDGEMHDRNHGGYLIGQQRVFGAGDALPAVDVFVQAGWAEADRNELKSYFGGGVQATGLVPSRPHDALGLAVASARTSAVFQRNTADATDAETAVELTYQAVVNEHFMIRPDLQYVIDPGAVDSVDNAWVAGVRAQFQW